MTRLIPLMLAGGLLGGAAWAPALAAQQEAARLSASEPAAPAALAIVDPWVREAPPGIRILAAYMTLVNPADRADRLLSAHSPLAGTIEIHRMIIKNGMMDMDAIPFLTIPAKGEVKLQPGGTHLMIYGMKRELSAGDRLPLELTFEHGGLRKLDVPVRKVTGKSHS
jgi:copper(I)-binding protein